MTNYVIRPLKIRDLPQLLKLARAYWQVEKIKGFCDKRYQRVAVKILKNPSMGGVWIATAGQRIIGYLVVVFLMSLEYGGGGGRNRRALRGCACEGQGSGRGSAQICRQEILARDSGRRELAK